MQNKNNNFKNQIEIMLLEPDGAEALIRFVEQGLKDGGAFRAFWEWRQEGEPFSGGETAIIAKVGEQITGCVGIVLAYITLNGAKIKASWQQDSLVSPSMRGKGVGKQLVIRGAEDWGMVISKGTNNAMYGLRKAVGFQDVPNSNFLLSVFKTRNAAKTLKEKLAEYVLVFWKGILPLPMIDKTISVKSIDSFDTTFDILADKLSKGDEIRLYKGQGYLNWRYFKCPGRVYKVFRAGEDQTRGAIVCKISGPYSDEGWIVDLICSTDDKKCAYALITRAMEYFKEQGISRSWVFATSPDARYWFYRSGYLPTGRTPRFTYRIQTERLDQKIIKDAKWNFWHGDGDVELYQ